MTRSQHTGTQRFGLCVVLKIHPSTTWLSGIIHLKNCSPNRPKVRDSLRLLRVVRDQNEHFGMGFPGQNHLEPIAAQQVHRCLSISRVTRRNDPLAVKKHLVAVCLVCASTVPIGDCQNTAAIGHRIDPKFIGLSARFIRNTCNKETHVNTGRVARELLGMIHRWFLSRQKGGGDETKEDDSKPSFATASYEPFRQHFAEDTTKQ